MCEGRSLRDRPPGPLTPAMRVLLAQMAATDAPAITDWRRRPFPTTLNGQTVNGATLNGLHIRGLASTSRPERMVTHFRLTDAGRTAAQTTSADADERTT